MSDPGSAVLAGVLVRLGDLKGRADAALARLSDEDLVWSPDPESNSVAHLVQHLAGNMLSRWTDFLTSDGEKPSRDRDAEFELGAPLDRARLRERWEQGWSRMRETLTGLRPSDLERRVTIRGQSLTALEAILRALAHTAEHVGQIVYLAKHRRSGSWESLSIPRKPRER
jgi:hypothetical protein